MNQPTPLDINELVYCNEGGKITAGGFLIDSCLLQKNGQQQGGSGGSGGSALNFSTLAELSNDLAVPAGLYLNMQYTYQQQMAVGGGKNKHKKDESEVIEDGLYERLLELAGHNNNNNNNNKKEKKKTRRINKKKNIINNNINKKSKKTKRI